MKITEKSTINLSSDYLQGAHPDVMKRLAETNLLKTAGYTLDEFSQSAREKIRKECNAPEADVFFLTGGTQTNAVFIGAYLKPYQGVIAADSAHISLHEAGAIEFGGHKVLTVPSENGKFKAEDIRDYIDGYYSDKNHEHMVMPGMVYISQPTECGTLYSLDEIEKISEVCRKNNIALYADGARLAYALACDKNDVSLADLARLCDAFYIGGTKCGTLFGEALVIPVHNLIPHLFTMTKQYGALLAKGRIAGVQFDTLFTDGLYYRLGRTAIDAADKIRAALKEKGYKTLYDSPTNQIFILFENSRLEEISRNAELGFWEKADQDHTVMRLASSWATTEEEVKDFISVI